jgi:mRNA interferase RelE/StbE
MKIEWSDMAQRTMRRFLADQEGMHAITAAVAKLADSPTPPEAFPWGSEGDYRLRVGHYRVMYRVGSSVITIGRVDCVSDR